MSVTNLLKSQVDQPVFEWLRPAPVATTATSTLFSADHIGRYMYYFGGVNLFIYDTYSDSWLEATYNTNTPSVTMSGQCSTTVGHRNIAISATTNTITVGGLGKNSKLVAGKKIRIIAGKGAGQERTITAVDDAVVADSGTAMTGLSVPTGIRDTTKRWLSNQWVGYTVRLTQPGAVTNPSTISKIVYNSSDALIFFDTPQNNVLIDRYNYAGFSSSSVGIGASTTHYVIESTKLTVDTPWSVTPDRTSVYAILVDVLFQAQPYPTSEYALLLGVYDSLIDRRSVPSRSTLPIPPLSTDFAIKKIDELGGTGGAFVSGLTATATSGTDSTLVNSGAGMSYDRWANYQLRITSGKGIGQSRRIVGNTDTTFFVTPKWGITLDTTSGYAVYGDTDSVWLAGNTSAALWKYSIENDTWSYSHHVDSGVARNISVSLGDGITETRHRGYAEEFTAAGITYSATGVLTVSVGAAGSGYTLGEVVNLTTTGSGAQVYITGISAGSTLGAVSAVQLAASGSGYTAVTTSNTTGGSGTGLTVNVTVGKVGFVGTSTATYLRHGDTVGITGCATDTTFNGNFTIIGISQGVRQAVATIGTEFSIAAPSATATPTAATTQSTTRLVDATKRWTPNQHVGRLLYIFDWVTGATFGRRIASNTETTLTVTGSALSAAPANGRSTYIIAEPRGFGAMVTTKVPEQSPFGWATSGTTTSLVDTSKNWTNNQWINCRVRVMCGTGEGNDAIITGNTPTTLFVSSWNVATPDATSKYEILDSFGIVTTNGTTTLTDAQKNWKPNALAGKRVRIIAGAGIGNETVITSNTQTVLTLGTSITTEASANNGSYYTIYEPTTRGTGTDIEWLYGLTDFNNRGRWMISPRGGGTNNFDIYDIPTNTWETNQLISPVSITLTTGSMYAYDGADSYLFTKDATGRIYELDLTTFQIYPCATIPYGHNTAVLGNRMEVVTTEDGLKYLYIMRHSGQEMWRTLKFW